MQYYVGIATALTGLTLGVFAFLGFASITIYTQVKLQEVSMTFWPKWAIRFGIMGFAGSSLFFIGQFIRSQS
jgi:hypothetical protein